MLIKIGLNQVDEVQKVTLKVKLNVNITKLQSLVNAPPDTINAQLDKVKKFKFNGLIKKSLILDTKDLN